MSIEQQAFPSEQLDNIYRGSISLGVPTFEDSIQVHADKIDGKARLNLLKSGRYVSLSREDGELLQIDVVERVRDSDGRLTHQMQRNPVLESPVAELVLKRNSRTQLWMPEGNGVEAIEARRTKAFAKVLGRYALMKQSETYPVLRLKESFHWFLRKNGFLE